MKKIVLLGLLVLLGAAVFVGCGAKAETLDVGAYLAHASLWDLPQEQVGADFQEQTDRVSAYYKKDIRWMDTPALLELCYDTSGTLSNVVVDFSFDPGKSYPYQEADRLIERIRAEFDERYQFQGAQVRTSNLGEDRDQFYAIGEGPLHTREYAPSGQQAYQNPIWYWKDGEKQIQLSCTIFPGECYLLVNVTNAQSPVL